MLLAAVRFGTFVAVGGCVVALYNRLTLPRLSEESEVVREAIDVCIPARNEAARLPDLIGDLRAQQGVPGMRVLILDDASSDGTDAAAAAAIGGDLRFTVIRSDTEPAPGWTGKAAACDRLAELSGAPADFAGRSGRFAEQSGIATDQSGISAERSGTSAEQSGSSDTSPTTKPPTTAELPDARSDTAAPGSVLVFLDADIRLAPNAIAAAVAELHRQRAALLSPWPRQRAGSAVEALVQPLLCWSWASTLPIRPANRSRRPSTAVACGQFLVLDAAAYRAIGGHGAVAASPTEDLDIARALRRSGRHTVLVAAGPLASTRMYRGATELTAGYTRWLWSAYGGSSIAAAAVGSVAALGYCAPPLAALLGSGRLRRVGTLGYLAAVVTRILARSTETGGSVEPSDILAALAHPIAVTTYLGLSIRSHRARRTNTLTWKGRQLTG